MNDESEQKLIEAFDMMWGHYPEAVRLIHRSFRVVAGNEAYLKAGGPVGVQCNVGDPAFHRGCQAQNALKTQETKILSNEMAGLRSDSYWVPVKGAEDYYVHFTNGLNALLERMAGQAPMEE